MGRIVWALLGATKCLAASNARCSIAGFRASTLIIPFAAGSVTEWRGAFPVAASRSFYYSLLRKLNTSGFREFHSRAGLRAAHCFGSSHTRFASSVAGSATLLITWATSTSTEWRRPVPIAIRRNHVASGVDMDVLSLIRFGDGLTIISACLPMTPA